ncbi:MAG TPA: penicillin-binding protein 2 [Microthrixaceae bacterium]|nr:penicillin-binding protein 2 [Microthrixaceae bacterium]
MSPTERATIRETHAVRRRLLCIGVVLALATSVLTYKMVGVQLRDGSDLAAKGRDQRSKTFVTPGQRGAILDRNGIEMAISVPRRRVVANMVHLAAEGVEDQADLQQFGAMLAPLLGVDVEALTSKLLRARASDPWVNLAETVDIKVAEEAVEKVEATGVEGALTLEESSERLHPAGESALRVIGTLGVDGPAKLAGIEKAFDEDLKGTEGKRQVEVSTKGGTILGGERVLEDAIPGSTVQLTLDRTMQHEVERILATGTTAASATRGIAIVGRPATGEILAIASVERNSKSGEMELSSGPLAFSNSYQVGSVLKLITVASAVESGQVNAETVLSVPDKIQIDDKSFEDSEPHPTQNMSVTQIVAESSNVGTIMIAKDVGKQNLFDALKNFGFGAKTGTAHPAEAAGILPPVEKWTRPDLAASAIGTHEAATAVQLWGAYNVIANAGMYVQPRIVDAVIDADGSRRPPKVEEPRRVVSAETASSLTGMLQAVVSEGTGKQWSLPGYSVAAKTGTSRLTAPGSSDRTDGYRWADGRYHHLAAFTGFLPAERPQVSITVLLEDVKEGLFGSTAAGPIFSNLARLSIRELGIAPTASPADSEELALLPGTTRTPDGRIRTTPAAVAVSDRNESDGNMSKRDASNRTASNRTASTKTASTKDRAEN